MDGLKKQVFEHRPGSWRKFLNRLGKGTQLFVALLGFSILFSSPLMYKSFKLSEKKNTKFNWIKTTFRDPDNTDPILAKLDLEEPPKPLPKLSGVEQFREEFRRLRDNPNEGLE